MARLPEIPGSLAVWIVLATALLIGLPALAQTPSENVPTLGHAGQQEAPELSKEQKISELNRKLMANPADGKAWNDLGVLYATEENFALARDSFIRAIQTAPTEGDYHRNLGLAFSRLEDFEMAVAEFEAYRKFDIMGGRDYWRLIGEAQGRAGLYAEAQQTFAEGIVALGSEPGPESMRLVLILNRMVLDQGDEQAGRLLLEEHTPGAQAFLKANDDETVPGYQEASAILHNRVTMLVDDAKLMEESGLPAEATELFQEAYELAPDRDDLLPRLVDAYIRNGELLQAKVAVRLARNNYPEQAGTWIASGKVYEQIGRLEAAVEAYQNAYRLDDSFDDLRVAIGNLLMRLDRDSEASEYLRAGVNSADTKPEVIYNYAVSLIREEKFHAAIPSLRNVVAQRPEMYQAWLALAQCLDATSQPAQASDAYLKAFDLNPDPKLVFHAGSAAQKSKQYDKAIDAYEVALALDSGYTKARYNLSLTYMAAGSYEEAVASFDQLILLEGESYRALYSKGLSHYYLGQANLALESFELAMEIKETPNLFNNIGLVHDKIGNKKAAQEWYKMAQDMKNGN